MMIKHRRHYLGALAAGAAMAVALVPASAPAKSSDGLTSFHGTVTSVSTAGKTFRIKRANGATLTFRVTSATTYERVGGRLSALTRGEAIEVKARRVDGRWTARKVEADDDGAGDDHGGGGDDDGANHDAGDDHGSGGHGADD
jgi:hypothetical protein